MIPNFKPNFDLGYLKTILEMAQVMQDVEKDFQAIHDRARASGDLATELSALKWLSGIKFATSLAKATVPV
ncbi:MAG: hypothetical protein V3S25_11550 [Nitrospirales bacterium]